MSRATFGPHSAIAASTAGRSPWKADGQLRSTKVYPFTVFAPYGTYSSPKSRRQVSARWKANISPFTRSAFCAAVSPGRSRYVQSSTSWFPVTKRRATGRPSAARSWGNTAFHASATNSSSRMRPVVKRSPATSTASTFCASK